MFYACRGFFVPYCVMRNRRLSNLAPSAVRRENSDFDTYNNKDEEKITIQNKKDMTYARINKITIFDRREYVHANLQEGIAQLQCVPANLQKGIARLQYVPANLQEGIAQLQYVPANLQEEIARLQCVPANLQEGILTNSCQFALIRGKNKHIKHIKLWIKK
jgi:hypothetical protein